MVTGVPPLVAPVVGVTPVALGGARMPGPDAVHRDWPTVTVTNGVVPTASWMKRASTVSVALPATSDCTWWLALMVTPGMSVGRATVVVPAGTVTGVPAMVRPAIDVVPDDPVASAVQLDVTVVAVTPCPAR